jgi:hypothetical protein
MPMNPRLLVPRATFDPDAAAYLRAVEAADGQALETPVKRAVDDFFKGCKADPSGIPGRSNWDAIKASCILCGARTLAGALVPLAGTAPTNVADGFVAGDYTRGGATPGLKGDGTSHLNSGRANDDDPQDDNHNAAFITQTSTVSGLPRAIMASRDFVTGRNYMDEAPTSNVFRASSRNQSAVVSASVITNGSLVGHSRVNASNISVRLNNATTVSALSSEAADSDNIFVFARLNASTGSAENFSDCRLAFYSIGEYLNLESLDARVTDLVTAIGAAV